MDREEWVGQARRALSAGLAHDLRTPLAHIRMFTEMLLMGHDRSSEERTRWLENIDRETHRLEEILENLLLFIHCDEPDAFPARRRTDLGALAEDVAASFTARAALVGARIHADPPAEILVMAESHALRQVLVNLLDNALRFGGHGQTITVSVRQDDGEAILTVADEGPGIAPGDRDGVWKPFVRLEGTGGGCGGGGVGLAVVGRVVQQHGGRVWIGDAAGGGAEVGIALPAAPAGSDERGETAGEDQREGPEPVQVEPQAAQKA